MRVEMLRDIYQLKSIFEWTFMDLKSSVEHLVWPVVQSGRAAQLIALQRQLDASQWWSPEQLRDMQMRQLTALAEHAYKNVPFYQPRLQKAGFRPGMPMDAEIWGKIPVLTRADVLDAGDRLYAKAYPASFGPQTGVTAEGPSAPPLPVRKTAVDQLLWEAAVLREQIWHKETVSGSYVLIRDFDLSRFSPSQSADINSARGLMLPDLGPPSHTVWHTGRLGIIHTDRPTADHVEFILKVQPVHLIASPSKLRLILTHFKHHDLRISSIKSVKALGERVDDALRTACAEVFGCKIIHNYTSPETGYIAIQCPESENFHVQSEFVLSVIVDADNAACGPEQIGRVLITPLHNFAMPLLRYEVGDEARAGHPCPCGRGLPVMLRVI